VLKLLDILGYQIGKARQILLGERPPFEALSSSSESDGVAGTSRDPSSEGSDIEDDSPWEISSDSELDESHLNTVEHRETTSTSLSQPIAQKTLKDDSTKPSELQQLLDSIKLSVTCLYKLPLRRPAPMDRLGDRSTEDISNYLEFDVAHVRNKFPDGRLDTKVSTRLGKMITRRRQLLQYREKHKHNLQTDIDVPRAQSAYTPKDQTVMEAPTQLTTTKSSKDQIKVAPSQPESSHRTLQSKATTMKIDNLTRLDPIDLHAPSVVESESKTSLAASEFAQGLFIEAPPRPKNYSGAELTRFECQFCFLTPYIRSDRAWK
jgi:hypothetical protein